MTTKDKRRKRDSHIKSASAKRAANVFVEAYTADAGKGAAQRAAQIAYPNQSPISASQTANELLKNPYIQQQIQKRQAALAQMTGIDRNTLVNCLMGIIFTSINDIRNETGDIDWKVAQERGIDHLIQEETVTDRHSKDGSSRRTRTVKMPSKIHAMDLLSDLTGWKREPQKNPIDLARQTYLVMRQDARYTDVPNEELAAFPAQRFKVSVAEILEGQPT